MPDTTLTIVLAFVGAIIASLVAQAPAIILALRNSGKLTQIHTLTNSSLSEMTSSLKVANEKILGLEKLITEKEKPVI